MFYYIYLKEVNFILNKTQVDVVIEQRFYQCAKNDYWTENSFPYSFWQRYLEVFDQVNIVARVSKVTSPEKSWHKVNGEKVTFFSLPHYIGLKGFFFSLPALLKVLFQRRHLERCVIFRVPSVLAFLYHVFGMPFTKQYGVEVVGDPADTFSKNANSNFLRPIIRSTFIYMLKWQCKNAHSISYVTEYSLQKKYPPKENAFQTYYSSIQLTESDFHQRKKYKLNKVLKVICIGNLAQPYKGCDFMLNSIAALKKQNIIIELRWIGGGILLESMKGLAKTLNISEQVNFIGNVSERTNIIELIDTSDLFILSSRQEGLPRVVIEAMARSLVCVATNVGGVCELLSPEFIIDSDNITQLTSKIVDVINMSETDLLTVSGNNYSKSLNYKDSLLSERRRQMYINLRKNI